MSLKAFHILFVTISCLLAFGFGVWSLQTGGKATSVLAFAAGIGLIIYGIKFYQKIKKLS